MSAMLSNRQLPAALARAPKCPDIVALLPAPVQSYGGQCFRLRPQSRVHLP